MANTLPRTHTIVHNPRILGGEPIIAGTRIAVRIIVQTARMYPDMADILEGYPSLDEEDVRVALAYYDAHRDEIEGWIAFDAASDDEPLP